MFAHTTWDLYFLDGISGIFGYSNIRRMDMKAASGRGGFCLGDVDQDVDWIYISLKKEDRSGMKRGRRVEFFCLTGLNFAKYPRVR
jgi:hypothetical protein